MDNAQDDVLLGTDVHLAILDAPHNLERKMRNPQVCVVTRAQAKLELTKHITPHANGEPLLKLSSPHSLLSSSATILLVWSANGDAPFQGKFQVNLLNDDTY